MDLGYQGLDKHFLCQGLIQGIKRKKGQKLSEYEKEFNRRVSQLRIKVEHAIAGLKRYRILYDKLRIKSLLIADQVVELGAGLWNYYIKSKLTVLAKNQ